MTENIYIFKEFTNNGYINYTNKIVSVPFKPLIHFNNLSYKYIHNITSSLIPEDTLKLLKQLVEYYNVEDFIDEFTSLMIFSQSMYIEYYEISSDELINIFIEEDKEYLNLLNIIEQYLFVEKNKLQSITFKFQQKDPKISPINDNIVLGTILKSICQSLVIDKDNFKERKNEIVASTEIIKPNKGGDYIRMVVVKSLFHFLKSKINFKSDSYLLRFCGYFLHLCQIPYNQKITEIQIENLQDGLDIIEPSVIRNFIGRPNKVRTN